MTQHDIYISREIGNYRITQEIATGSFGTVYLASHLYLKQRIVVIKILHAVRLGSDEEKEQFLQEAQILETLKGLPNILPLLDVGIDGNVPYMIAEYAQRGSLRMLMQQRGVPLPSQEVLTIIEQVGRGLQNAHDQGIVHRDLKPENILFNAKGEALLADFGLSAVLLTGSVIYTQVAGTPSYMAPEQFIGEVCKESDQYALACIAYELLTGHKLFEAQDFVSVGFLHNTKAPTPPRQFNLQIPASVEHVLLRALSKERTERYPSVSAFVAAFNNSDNDEDQNTLLAAQGQPILPALPEDSIPDMLPPPTSSNQLKLSINENGPEGSEPQSLSTMSSEPTEVFSPPLSGNETANATRKPTRDRTDLRRQEPARSSTPFRTPPKRNKRAKIIVALIIMILFVIGGVAVSASLGILNNIIPGHANTLATITITSDGKTVQDTYQIQGVTGNPNPDSRQVTVRPLTSTKTTTDVVSATGHAHTPGTAATGSITFFNSSFIPFFVEEGITFQVDDVQIKTDAAAIVPRATLAPVQAGQATVSAHAIQGGAAGNIVASAINEPCPCDPTGHIKAQNLNAFTGGQEGPDYTFLQTSDITRVTNAHLATLRSDAQNDIKGQMKPGEQLPGDINCDQVKTTADVQPGNQGPTKAVASAHVTVSVTCNAKAYDAMAVQMKAQNALKQKALNDLGTRYALASPIGVQILPLTQQDGNITFQVTAQGIWSYQWADTMKQDLLNKIKGKSTKDAQAMLNNYPGVGNAKIDIINSGTTLPSDPNQIRLDVKAPNGL